MNLFRTFIVFSMGYTIGTLAMMLMDMTSKANVVITMVLLIGASLAYISRRDEDMGEQIVRIFSQIDKVDDKIKRQLNERYEKDKGDQKNE